jgi:hypothetical protein
LGCLLGKSEPNVKSQTTNTYNDIRLTKRSGKSSGCNSSEGNNVIILEWLL